MRRKLKKGIITAILIGSLGYWYSNYYMEQEIPMYSLKCVHDEYDEVIRWFLLKRKRKEEIPSALYDGPWLSNKFSLASGKKHLTKTAILTLATARLFKFSSLSDPEREIHINRQNLKLKVENYSDYSHSCEIRNPGEFSQYVEQKLKIEKSELKI